MDAGVWVVPPQSLVITLASHLRRAFYSRYFATLSTPELTALFTLPVLAVMTMLTVTKMPKMTSSKATTNNLRSFCFTAFGVPEKATQQFVPRDERKACSRSAETSVNETQQFVRSVES